MRIRPDLAKDERSLKRWAWLSAQAAPTHSRGRRGHGYFPEQSRAGADRTGGEAGLQISCAHSNGVERRIQSLAADAAPAAIRGTAQRTFGNECSQARGGPPSISPHQ